MGATFIPRRISEQLDTSITGVANDDFLQRKSGAWANRTVAQVKADLGLPITAFNGTVGAATPSTVAATTGTFSGQVTASANGAASAPAVNITGVPFAGTGTTSFPLVFINETGAAASTTLNTAGTLFGVNGNGTADLMNLLKDGVSQCKVTSGGALTASTVSASWVQAQIYVGTSGLSTLKSPSSGVITALNSAETDFARLQLGGTTSSFPSIKRSGATLAFRLADDSADCTITAGKATFSGSVILPSYTVAGLPAAASNTYGRAFVTDANATTFNSTVAGGGANKVPVWSDGTNWIIG